MFAQLHRRHADDLLEGEHRQQPVRDFVAQKVAAARRRVVGRPAGEPLLVFVRRRARFEQFQEPARIGGELVALRQQLLFGEMQVGGLRLQRVDRFGAGDREPFDDQRDMGRAKLRQRRVLELKVEVVEVEEFMGDGDLQLLERVVGQDVRAQAERVGDAFVVL